MLFVGQINQFNHIVYYLTFTVHVQFSACCFTLEQSGQSTSPVDNEGHFIINRFVPWSSSVTRVPTSGQVCVCVCTREVDKKKGKQQRLYMSFPWH